jgi:hypothetical protein
VPQSAYSVLVGKLEANTSPGRPRHRWGGGGNIKMDFRVIGFGAV